MLHELGFSPTAGLLINLVYSSAAVALFCWLAQRWLKVRHSLCPRDDASAQAPSACHVLVSLGFVEPPIGTEPMTYSLRELFTGRLPAFDLDGQNRGLQPDLLIPRLSMTAAVDRFGSAVVPALYRAAVGTATRSWC